MKELWKNLKFVWPYAKEQKLKLIIFITINFLGVIISVVTPILSAKAIISLTENKLNQLIMIALAIFIVENIRNLIRYKTRYYSQYIYRETFAKLQIDLGQQILKLENEVIDKNSSGVFIQRLTNDTSRLADIFNTLNFNLSTIITDLGIFVAVFIINKIAFIYLTISVIIIYILENIKGKKYTQKDKETRVKNERLSGFVGEMVRGVRDIKMLNAEDTFTKELQGKIIDLNKAKYDILNTDRKYSLLIFFVNDLEGFLLIALLVVMIGNNSLAIPSALVIYNYSKNVSYVATFVGMLLDKVRDFNLSSERIFAIINNDEFKKEEFGPKHLTKIKGNFEFKNVDFSYSDGTKVLQDLSFKINANETVAFVGKSGAGKTTIFNLLCKMYIPSKGTITIDDVNILELDKDSIRGNITIISQNPYIFNLSIKDNLKLVKSNLTDEEIKEACKTACLDDFIESLPDKYDTIVGEGGVNLSGGQKQRLAIARALIQKTEIILFDEATSALDNETQEKIQQAIENMKKEYTILIIAHRLSTVVNSDRILYLEDGKIEAEGTHSELIKNCSKYKKLYESEIAQNQ